MSHLNFHVQHTDGQARLGSLETAHGSFETPMFMPVGTRACVKALTMQQVRDIGAQIILGNTYHLMLRPGKDLIKKAGGLHAFMNWDKPILTDSGGFQVFSLSNLNKITDEGVRFKSHIDGQAHFLGPEESMEIQRCLGSDIVMVFDECASLPCTREKLEAAWQRTHRWAKICRNYELLPHQNLFAIVQGGCDDELRQESASELAKMDFEGYAIGGLSVGEPAEDMYRTLDVTTPLLPQHKPRYLMGVGTPRNMIEAVRRGVDMFDCVMPTRNARNGTAFTWEGKISMKAARYKEDFTPLDARTPSEAAQYSRAYLRHLFNVDEMTACTLLSLQNLAFYLAFMEEIRHAIRENRLEKLYQEVCQIYPV